jgi:transposase
MQQTVVQRYTVGAQPMRQIAAELGCSYGTVHLLLTRAGTPRRPRGGARRTRSSARVNVP